MWAGFGGRKKLKSPRLIVYKPKTRLTAGRSKNQKRLSLPPHNLLYYTHEENSI
jgi:hypothetical protein